VDITPISYPGKHRFLNLRVRPATLMDVSVAVISSSSEHMLICKAILTQVWAGPECSRKLRLPEILDIWHTKVARLSAVGTGHLYSSADTPGTHIC